MKNKFNKGDLVEIIQRGQCWTSYEEKFEELGMNSPKESRKTLPEGTQGMVLHSVPRYKDSEKEDMVVIFFENQTYLYSSTGIRIVQAAINESYEIY